MKQFIHLFIFSIVPFMLKAQSSSGLPFLDIAPSALELALSEANTATPNGASSIYKNPALLVMQNRPSISLNFTNWIQDSKNLSAGINLKKNKRAFAFAFYTAGVNDLEQRNKPGKSNGEFGIQYVAISGAYARDFNWVTAGIALSYLNEDIFPYRSNGYAFNIGVATTLFEDKIRIGSSLINSGSMEKLNERATNLPTSLNFGIAVDILQFIHRKSPYLPILATIMVDFVHPIEFLESNEMNSLSENSQHFNFGLKLLVSDVIEIRSGYKTENSSRPISFGLGLVTNKVTFNYAIIPFNTGFGTVHSVGLQYKL